MSRPFPDHPFLQGSWEPWPMEGEIHDLVVEGEIPRDLSGTLYRNGPNQQFSPRDEYHPFSGDGMIHAFAIEDGRARYRNRWVQTPRFLLEREAGKSLFASFGDMTKSDPSVSGVAGGPANTNVVWHGGRLLALVEGGLLPVELDPETLDTRGIVDLDGGLLRDIDPTVAKALGIDAPNGKIPGTFTAHPKIDPETGEMLAFGYAGTPPYLVYYVLSPDGKLARKEEIDLPFPSMVHDFITTRDHVIFPIFPATLRIERMAQGRNVLGWEPDLGTHVGVMPRDGGNADVVWLQTNPSFSFHPMNAHDEGDKIIAEMAQYPQLPIPAEGIDGPALENVAATLTRWTIDLSGGSVKEEPIDDRPLEFPRLDERFTGLDYRYGYAAGGEGDLVSGMQSILRYDVRSGVCEQHDLGTAAAAGEPIFVPRGAGAAEGAGYLLSVVYRADERRSDLVILDAENIADAPLARVRLPHRVPSGFHGNWRQED